MPCVGLRWSGRHRNCQEAVHGTASVGRAEARRGARRRGGGAEAPISATEWLLGLLGTHEWYLSCLVWHLHESWCARRHFPLLGEARRRIRRLGEARGGCAPRRASAKPGHRVQRHHGALVAHRKQPSRSGPQSVPAGEAVAHQSAVLRR
jgi:hypothetical protein